MTRNLILAFILSTFVVLFSMFVSALIISWSDFKHYKSVYKSLPFRNFTKNGNQIYSDSGFCWFCDSGDFEIRNEIYIHNAGFTYFSIYGWYWLNKYQRWFNENIDIEKLDNHFK